MSQTFSRAVEGIGIALDSLRASKVRAALTILGVAIGVMVVIAMASAITGINRALTKELESAGPRTFFVERYFQGGLNISDGSDELSPWRRMPWITVAEAELIRQLPAIQDVSVQEFTSGPVKYGDVDLTSVQVAGFGPAWVYVTGGQIVAGRSFTASEYSAGSRVVVINDKLAETLFPGLDPIGKTIKIFGLPFEVIGLHVEAASLFGGGDNARLAIPHTTFEKVADYWKGWMDIAVLPVEGVTVEEAQDQVVTALRASRGLKPSQENNFAILTQEKMLETFDKMTGAFFLVMLALSSGGLMVGGVGVVAIMMISVTERTREIGVRKALGARRSEILFQFLMEAAFLTSLGGVIGIALGSALGWAVHLVSGFPISLPWWSFAIGLGFSASVGIFFGMWPAVKASRLDPIEALRYE